MNTGLKLEGGHHIVCAEGGYVFMSDGTNFPAPQTEEVGEVLGSGVKKDESAEIVPNEVVEGEPQNELKETVSNEVVEGKLRIQETELSGDEARPAE